jgi:CRISPR-associated endonuclease Csn1
LNTKVLFNNNFSRGDTVFWDKDVDLKTVINTYNKNNVHLTRYAYCQKGGLFDQMPVKKGEGQVPLKAGMDISKYGGYNKSTSSFFVIARYLRGGKREVSFVPVDLMIADRFMQDDAFAASYVQDFLQGINTKKIENVEFPIGKRQIKLKSVIRLDGYNLWVNGKANKGARVLLSSAESAIYPVEYVAYIKNIENYIEKKKKNRNFLHDENYDGLTCDANVRLYNYLIEKLNSTTFRKLPGNQYDIVSDGVEKFVSLDFDNQLNIIIACIDLMKSGRTGGCDLSLIGAKGKTTGNVYIGANLSSCKYEEVKLIDISPAGLHVKESINLKELL